MISKENSVINKPNSKFFKVFMLTMLLFLFLPLFSGCATTEKTAYMDTESNLTYTCEYNAETNETRIEWSTYFTNNSIYNITEFSVKFNLYFENSLIYQEKEFFYDIDIGHGQSVYKNCRFTISGHIDKIAFAEWHAEFDNLWNSYKGWWIGTIVGTIILSIVILICIFAFELDLDECLPWLLPILSILVTFLIASFSIDSIGWVVSCMLLGGIVIVALVALISWFFVEGEFEPKTLGWILVAIVAFIVAICGCIFWEWWAVLVIVAVIALGIGIFLIIKNSKEEKNEDDEDVNVAIEKVLNLSVVGLKEICSQIGISGYSKLKRDELLELILSKFTIQILKGYCYENGFSGYSKLKKDELIKFIINSPDEDDDEYNNDENDNKNIQVVKKPAKDTKSVKTKEASNKKITFDDIAGLEEAKEAFREKVIMPFEHPELYKKYGKKVGGGILLYGLPGTGKTMFAEAASNEVNALFIPIKCSDIKSKWYGESEQKVKNIFLKAKKAERAIIFFDEFEAIGAKRNESPYNGNNDLVPEILAEMQGFGNSNDNSTIVVIAATNKPWSIDSAFLRPGRFDEKIYIPLPDDEARKKLFELKLKNTPNENLDYNELSKITKGFNGADINEFCEKLKMKAIKKSLKSKDEYLISMKDVEEVSKVIKSSVSQKDIDDLETFESKK